MVLQTEIAHKKKTSSRLKYIDGFIPSMSVNYRHNISVGQGVGDCEICTKLLWNANGLISFVNLSLKWLTFPALCQMPTDTVCR
jgi:hypothetical protein